MNEEHKSIGEFLQNINKEIVSALISRQHAPLNPEKAFTCFMTDTRVQFDLRVNARGEVTDAQDVAASLHLEFRYVPAESGKD